MIKEKKKNIVYFVLTLAISGLIYLSIGVLCNMNVQCYYTHQNLIPFVFALLGLSASLLLLLFFNSKIFISWAKYIAWWYLILVLWFIVAFDMSSGGGFIGLYTGPEFYISILMAVLFIITLVYAVVATLIQKKKQGSTPE